MSCLKDNWKIQEQLLFQTSSIVFWLRVLLKPPTTDPPTTYYTPINPPTAYHELTLKQRPDSFVIIYFLNNKKQFNAILYIDLIFGFWIRIELRVCEKL